MSLRKAVDNHCRSCQYDILVSGSWRRQVEECEMVKCFLHPYRPKTIKKKSKGTLPATVPLADPFYIENSPVLAEKMSMEGQCGSNS
jgi:hypothetical protein